MGTNYYLHENVCAHCGRSDEPLHIGKSSSGWCFSLHVIPDQQINSLDDWKERWSKSGVIRNEYGDEITAEHMLEVITVRGNDDPRKGKPYMYDSWGEFHAMNDSCDGPRNLVRHRLGRRCVGHGEGTWDLIPGEFS